MLHALELGARLGLAYHPLTSLVAAPVVAALAARSPRRHALLGLPGLLLLAAWFAADGGRPALLAADAVLGSRAAAAAAGGTVPLAALALWMLVGFAVGYLLPAWSGAFVGRRVTHGTGWLAAAFVSVTLAAALVTALGSLHR